MIVIKGKKKLVNNAIIVIILSFLFSCMKQNKATDDNPVARAGDKKLYMSDLMKMLPQGLSPKDSIRFCNEMTGKWVKKQILLQKAEKSLSDEMPDIEHELSEYRSSLLIFRLEDKQVRQKMDTVVTENEIKEYYLEYGNMFRLDRHVVIPSFVRIPRTAKDAYKVRNWIRSKKDKDIHDLFVYCRQYSDHFILNNQWIYFSDIIRDIPVSIYNPEQFLKYTGFIEAQDSLSYHYLYIKEYKLKNDVAPLVFIQNDLKKIILNKKRVQFIKQFENSILEENKNDWKIYSLP